MGFHLTGATIGDAPSLERIACAFGVLQDNPITLAVGGDIDHTFEFVLDKFAVTVRPVIISFVLDHAESLQLELILNEESHSRNYSPGPERTVHEVMAPALHLSSANELTLRVLHGSCKISDIVVWYQIQA